MSPRRMEGCSQSINKIFADEIINYFLLSWDIEIPVTFAIICLTILVNISLLFAIMITGNVEKFCSSLEVIRGLAEGLMHSIHNSGSFQKYVQHYRPHSMLRRILVFFAGSVNLGLIKSLTGFLRFSDKRTFSRQWLIIMVMFAAFTLITFVVLCVLYITNIHSFVIFICFLYFIPFIGMWIFDGLRFH